jgi:hypothetical protein
VPWSKRCYYLNVVEQARLSQFRDHHPQVLLQPFGHQAPVTEFALLGGNFAKLSQASWESFATGATKLFYLGTRRKILGCSEQGVIKN